MFFSVACVYFTLYIKYFIHFSKKSQCPARKIVVPVCCARRKPKKKQTLISFSGTRAQQSLS